MAALVAEARTDFGKGAARRMRREGRVPAVVYGHGTAPVHVHIDAHELTLTLRKRAASIEVVIGGKTEIVAPRDIQIDPVRRFVEHVDLVLITAAEAATLTREAAESKAASDAAVEAATEAAASKAAAREISKAAAEAAGEKPAEDSAE